MLGQGILFAKSSNNQRRRIDSKESGTLKNDSIDKLIIKNE